MLELITDASSRVCSPWMYLVIFNGLGVCVHLVYRDVFIYELIFAGQSNQ